ncbi:MAG: superoxide dismutase family protein [Clostridia bacterium]|nr:superoxide dismutase family protein [Oscillospiraceae bacterium]MBQ7960673.1 superoxide dismutase family protein [Clostridia bacterium]
MLEVYDAIANIYGSDLAPEVHGTVKFLGIADGSWIEAEIFGLPDFSEGVNGSPQIGPFGFHIHEKDTCGSVHTDNPFTAAGGHWNPEEEPHGNHAGDFPVLFSNGGTAKMLFFTNRFFPSDVIGRSVVIHQSPDDYVTQPSGSGGKRIACGSIVAAGEGQ